MNNQFSLHIKTPCTEDFNNFSPTKKGGFCDSCTKEVIDFSTMNTQEITTYFKTNPSKNICGRFKSHQLKTYTPTTKRKKRSLLSWIAFACITFFSFSKTQAQDIKNPPKNFNNNNPKFQRVINENNITVKGIVTENGTPLAGANVILEGTSTGVSTDFDGNFEFPVKLKKGDVLAVNYIGFKSKKVVIEDKNSANKIALQVNLKVDACVLMGKISFNKVYSSKND